MHNTWKQEVIKSGIKSLSGSKIVVALNYLALIWRDLEVMESNGKDLVKLILMYPASLYLLKVNYTNPRTRC